MLLRVDDKLAYKYSYTSDI